MNGARDSCRAVVERFVVVSVRRAATVLGRGALVRDNSFDKGRVTCLAAIGECRSDEG